MHTQAPAEWLSYMIMACPFMTFAFAIDQLLSV